MNAKLQMIGESAAQDLQDYILENEESILDAWHEAESAGEDESGGKFKLGFTITVDIAKDKMETALTWAIRFKAYGVRDLPDPDQPQLPIETKGGKRDRN